MMSEYMNNRSKVRKKKTSYKGKKDQELPSRFYLKLFISMSILLIVLLMKKYDLSLGQINTEKIYEVVYYQEDFQALKDKVLEFNATPE